MRKRIAAAVVAVIAVIFLAWQRLPSRAEISVRPPAPIETNYGEALLHAVSPADIDVSYLMPMGSIASAVLFSHGRLADWQGWFVLLGALALLVVYEGLAGHAEEARADLQAVLELDGAFLPAYISLEAIETRERHLDRAVELYDRALASSGAGADPRLVELIRASRREIARDP